MPIGVLSSYWQWQKCKNNQKWGGAKMGGFINL